MGHFVGNGHAGYIFVYPGWSSECRNKTSQEHNTQDWREECHKKDLQDDKGQNQKAKGCCKTSVILEEGYLPVKKQQDRIRIEKRKTDS
ncbi:MAG: hypothetical protein K2N87_05190 [Eubacterium sp.]|nr:hypothetical protein [Eubacterium sp.]